MHIYSIIGVFIHMHTPIYIYRESEREEAKPLHSSTVTRSLRSTGFGPRIQIRMYKYIYVHINVNMNIHVYNIRLLRSSTGQGCPRAVEGARTPDYII